MDIQEKRRLGNKYYIILLFIIIATIFVLPIFSNFDNWGIQDWDVYTFYHAVPRATILDYHQIPLWNPYCCGGIVLLANPQTRILSPSFLLILIFNAVRGLKIDILLHLIVGMLGVYWLARHYGLDSPCAIISSSVFMLSGMFASNLTTGIVWFLTVAYLPWAFLFYLKAFDDLKYSFVSGIFLALIFFEGGTVVVIFTLSLFFIYSLFLIKEQKAAKAGKILCIVLAYGLCLSAIKLFPCLEFMHKYPRYIHDYSGFSLSSLGYSLFGRDQTVAAIDMFMHKSGFFKGVSYNMDENGMYIGIIPFLLFLIGLGVHHKRKMPLVLCFIFFLWLSFGNRIQFSPWDMLHRFPVYNQMRVAQRFRIIFMLCLSIFAGFGFKTIRDYVSRIVNNRTLLWFFELICIVVILDDLTVVNSPVWKDAFPISPLKVTRSAKFYQVFSLPFCDKDGIVTHRGHYSASSSLYPAFLSNIGVIYGNEATNGPLVAIPSESNQYKGEVWIDGAKGEARFIKWSPNRLLVGVNTTGEGYLVINQNYYPGWRVKGNKAQGDIMSIKGLLAVRILPSDKEIELYYLPTSFIIGLIVTFITFLLSVILIFNYRRNRGCRAAAK